MKPEAVVTKIQGNDVPGIGHMTPTGTTDDVTPFQTQCLHSSFGPLDDKAFVVGVVVQLTDVEVEVVGYFLDHSFAHTAIRWRSFGNSVFMTSSLMHRLRYSVIFSSVSGVGIGIVYEVFELFE